MPAAFTSCPPSPVFTLPYWKSDARGAIVSLTRYVAAGISPAQS